jgi:hypothetical protein
MITFGPIQVLSCHDNGELSRAAGTLDFRSSIAKLRVNSCQYSVVAEKKVPRLVRAN